VRRRRENPILERVTIEDVAAEGKAIARVNDKVVFVTYGVPGDIVDIQVIRKRKSFMEGYITKYHELSKLRVEPVCKHFGTCGGCKWQNLPYAEQLKFKQKQVTDQLTRIGKIDLPEINPILGSPQTEFYRNKLEFTFSNSRWLTREEVESRLELKVTPALGFHIPGMFDKILDLDECHLQPEPSNSIRNEVKRFALEQNMSFYNIRNREGLLRNIIIRNTSTGDLMVIVVFYENDSENIAKLMEHLKTAFPQITSLMYVINPKVNDTIGDLDIMLYAGKDHMVENMDGILFKIGPKSFFQTNTQQALTLYRITKEFAGLTGNELVCDLYTGTGTIANFVAKDCKKVVGIEYVPEAIEDAWVNAKLNNATNTAFYAGDIKDLLTVPFFEENGYPEIVILDPPRAGIHQDVADALLNAEPRRIVYVSCNPATQARDLNLLSVKYKVLKVQPVDMFPHTHHVENVVLLERV